MPLLASLLYQIAGLCAWSSSVYITQNSTKHSCVIVRWDFMSMLMELKSPFCFIFVFSLAFSLATHLCSHCLLSSLMRYSVGCRPTHSSVAHRRLKFCYSPLHRWGVVLKRSRARSYEVGTSLTLLYETSIEIAIMYHFIQKVR